MNLMLMKKLFNIITIFNKTVFVKAVKLHLKLIAAIEKVLYVVECL